QRRQPVIDAQRRGRRPERRASDEKLDPAARDNALDQLADFGLVLAPGARQIELELEKSLIERAHFRGDADFSAFDLSPSEAGHTAHLVFIPSWLSPAPSRRFSLTPSRHSPMPQSEDKPGKAQPSGEP